MVRCILINISDKRLWAEACSVAVYIRNRLPHSSLQGKTPYEALYKTKPTIAHLLPFGQSCFAHIHQEKRTPGSKLQPRAEKGIFIGYTDSSSIYRIQLENKRIIIIRAANCILANSPTPALANSPMPALANSPMPALANSPMPALANSPMPALANPSNPPHAAPSSSNPPNPAHAAPRNIQLIQSRYHLRPRQ